MDFIFGGLQMNLSVRLSVFHNLHVKHRCRSDAMMDGSIQKFNYENFVLITFQLNIMG